MTKLQKAWEKAKERMKKILHPSRRSLEINSDPLGADDASFLVKFPLIVSLWRVAQATLRETSRNGNLENEEGLHTLIARIFVGINTALFPRFLTVSHEHHIWAEGLPSGFLGLMLRTSQCSTFAVTAEVKCTLSSPEQMKKATKQSLARALSALSMNSAQISSVQNLYHVLVSGTGIRMFRITHDRRITLLWERDFKVAPTIDSCDEVVDAKSDFEDWQEAFRAICAMIVLAHGEVFGALRKRSKYRSMAGDDSPGSSFAVMPELALQQLQKSYQRHVIDLEDDVAEAQRKLAEAQRKLAEAQHKRNEDRMKIKSLRERVDKMTRGEVPSLSVTPSNSNGTLSTAGSPVKDTDEKDKKKREEAWARAEERVQVLVAGVVKGWVSSGEETMSRIDKIRDLLPRSARAGKPFDEDEIAGEL